MRLVRLGEAEWGRFSASTKDDTLGQKEEVHVQHSLTEQVKCLCGSEHVFQCSWIRALTCHRSYRNLSMRSRMLIGGGIMVYAAAGLLLSDKAEQAFGFVPTEEDKRRLKEAVPKIHVVDKKE